MENRIDELASIVEWVDDMALEPKWRLDAPARGLRRRPPRGLGRPQPRHAPRPARGCMVRRVRQEVLDQLPPRTDVRVPIEMTEEQLEEHDALIQPIIALMARGEETAADPGGVPPADEPADDAADHLQRPGAAQLRGGLAGDPRPCAPEESMIQGLSAPKLLELRQLVRQLVLDQGRKVVIFSQWRRMLTPGALGGGDLLAEKGCAPGSSPAPKDRNGGRRTSSSSTTTPAFRLLFASDAGGVGLNLQHAANCVINLELPWNPAVLEQRIGRIYRLGQKNPIDVYNLVCEEGIESRIAGLVGSKQAFFKGLFDGDSDAVQFDQSGSFMSRIEQIYDPEQLKVAVSNADAEVRPAVSTTTWKATLRRSLRPPIRSSSPNRPSPWRPSRLNPCIPWRPRPARRSGNFSGSFRSAARPMARSSSRPLRKRPPP